MAFLRRGRSVELISADFPGLRVKHLTGTTAGVQGSSDLIAHGVNEDQIVCWMASVKNDANTRVPEGYNLGASFEFYVSIIPGGWLEVRNAPLNSANILTKPIDILLFYIN